MNKEEQAMTITRKTSIDMIRRYCIKYDLCTLMDNDMYERVLIAYSKGPMSEQTAIDLGHCLTIYSETDMTTAELVAGILNEASYCFVEE